MATPTPAKPQLRQTEPAQDKPIPPQVLANGEATRQDEGLTGNWTPSPNGPRPSTNGHVQSDRSSGRQNGSANTPSLSLQGRVALVTGSGRSVGRTIARFLAARGATVVVNSFHSRTQGEETAAEINAAGGKAVHIWGSIANPDHVESIFQQIEQQFGGLDILICNASDGQIGSFMDLDHDDWDRAFRTNVIGHHDCAKRAVPLMQSRGGGSIVTMSAMGAHHFVDGLGSQGVAKAAVESFTRYLACSVGRFGIRVNCVAGGPVYGDLISKFPDAENAKNQWEAVSADGQPCRFSACR